MSSKVYGLLKRPDEAVVVARAHSNPKFVEDCVRTMAQKVVETFVDLPDEAYVTLKQINEEIFISIMHLRSELLLWAN